MSGLRRTRTRERPAAWRRRSGRAGTGVRSVVACTGTGGAGAARRSAQRRRARERRERQGAVGQDRVVEPRMSNAAPRRRSRLRADPQQLQLAGLVGEGLAGERDVAVDLVRDGARRERRVGEHVVDRLLARPAHRVDAGVDDEPRRPPGVERQHPEAVEVAGVEPHLVGQPLGVQAPALEVGRGPEVAAEVGQPASSWPSAPWRWWPGTASW